MTPEASDVPASLRRARALTRDIEPPPDAQARVRVAVDVARSRGSRSQWFIFGGVAAAAVALALWIAAVDEPSPRAEASLETAPDPSAPVALDPDETDRVAEVLVTSPEAAPGSVLVLDAAFATVEGADLDVGMRLADDSLVAVAAGGHARLTLRGATLDLEAGSAARVGRDGVRVTSGEAIVLGDAYIEAGPCHATVRGRGRVLVDDSGAHYRILEANPHGGPDDVCWFEFDLPEPEGRAPALTAPTDTARATSDRGAGESDLAVMMAAVAEARTLRDRDDAAALARWREIRRRWPGRGLDEEIDLYIVDALVGLADRDGARREAERFLTRHPSSAHTDRMRALTADGTTDLGPATE